MNACGEDAYQRMVWRVIRLEEENRQLRKQIAKLEEKEKKRVRNSD